MARKAKTSAARTPNVRTPIEGRRPEPKIIQFDSGHSIFGEDKKSFLAKILKIKEGTSRQGVVEGEQHPSLDFSAIYDLKRANIHHSRCINTKKHSTVGLGFTDDKVAVALDPLCKVSWQSTLNKLADDYWQTGNCYLEVVREKGSGNIVGLHHARASRVRIVVESRVDFHYRYYSNGSMIGTVPMACFGEAQDMASTERVAAMGRLGVGLEEAPKGETVSELIHICQEDPAEDFYGSPDFIANVPWQELVQMMVQNDFDFFNNSASCNFAMFFLGAQVDNADWDVVKTQFKRTIGLGNRHKGFIANLASENLKVQKEQLGSDNAVDGTMFVARADALSLAIVSAHGVPPLLAGIVTPGKIGAANELPNALMAFQTLVIGPAQHAFETVLAVTLGNPDTNGGLGLTREDFVAKFETDEMTGQLKKVGGLRTILQAINVNQADTVGRMREPLAEAQAKGRDLGAGLKD